jgi:hypothetical protein
MMVISIYLFLLIRLSFLVKSNMVPFTMCWKKILIQIILLIIARKDKLEGELNHELSADYNELMKKLSESFADMHENSVQYYKQKANEELDKMEKTYNQVIN